MLVYQLQMNAQSFVVDKPGENRFSLKESVIVVDQNEEALVKRSAALLQQDIYEVTGQKPELLFDLPQKANSIIVIGTVTKSSFLKKLEYMDKLRSSTVRGKWEAFQILTLDDFSRNIQKALVIQGSDRRGAAYGAMEISKQIGVSPWYWWADVPVKMKKEIFIDSKFNLIDSPRVKYRGIFINDEAPALSNWSKEKFGGFNHKFYEKVFELMLRLKANYIWPAMWGNAFYDDDPLNIKTAEDYGIVIGTSHHEPLMRAHDEWRRYGNNQKWNYDSTEKGLRDFWRKGMARATNEKIVSVGMRGDGDEPMSRETATALLERIVRDQRKIIEEVTGKPVEQTPQLWALYKEVQDYYDKGMRVPDDVTLLLCDDNWGNIRRLPPLNEKPRKGGYGIYYHFDYVGGPRNYKWINTNSIPRVWEQMHLAWEYKARQIWIVNVGDIKPMEFPISFFLDYAWNPEKIGPNDLQKYTLQWASDQFGEEYAKDIASFIGLYTKFNARRKPELIDPNSYNLHEFQQMVMDYKKLNQQAEMVREKLPEKYRDAYYQLVLHPIEASSNLYQLYYNVRLNHYYALLKHGSANEFAMNAKGFYINDSLISVRYHSINQGKWNHLMDQTHIGYTGWQQPIANKLPELKYVQKEEEVNTDKRLINAATEGPPPDGYVLIAADHYTKANNTNGITWTLLPDHGRTGSAITTFAVTAASQTLNKTSPSLEYAFYTTGKDSININLYFSPTLNFQHSPTGLQFAVSIDDDAPTIISLNKEDGNVRIWEKWVADNIIIKSSSHFLNKPGNHVLKYWMIDPGPVLQKITIDFGNLAWSYLGPEETIKK